MAYQGIHYRRPVGSALRVALSILAAGVTLWPSAGRAQSGLTHRTGQNVVPVYDGYEQNTDGTLTLWFGYMNRNAEEAIDVPVGPENNFVGATPDRGQPTHFRPRRQKVIFSVVVPEAEAKSVKWSLTTKGKTETATATILPSSMIRRDRGTLNSEEGAPPNTPPVVTAVAKAPMVSLTEAATIDVSATDDGQPKRSFAGASMKPGLTASWLKFRGPGDVTFTPQRERLADNGKLTTKMTFTQPGEYQLLVSVDDGSASFGEYCCWTNALVKVTVRETR